MKSCWFVVIRTPSAWWVDCEGKAYGPFEDRDEAQSQARRIAMTYGDDGRRSEVFAPTDQGSHRLIWKGPVPTAS